MQNLMIDGDRLWQTIMETAALGATADGGVRRLTLGEEDKQVRDWFRDECEAVGCTVEVDEVGNMFARRPGRSADALPIAIGSHLDTQPTGGKFDGILGVLAGLEIFRTLHAAGYETEMPLMLVNWTNEEGARFAPAMLGSGVHAGVFDKAFADSRTDADGVSFAEAIEDIGYRGTMPIRQIRFAAMFELHIEQGPVLERENADIGIVTGVQAMRWYDLAIRGREAHAGSTPMDMRCDALADAASIILETQAAARSLGAMATTGQLSIISPSRNVIPGHVTLSLDLRHESDEELDRLEAAVSHLIAKQCGERAHLEVVWNSPAVRFDPRCIQAVREAAEKSHATTSEIVSGAGHDSVYVSRVAPTAMIFIPCKDGVSHNPAESAEKDQCTMGTQVLLETIIAYQSSMASEQQTFQRQS
ncbi:Zn-dependent hydrolase (plasmid) [Agrobacterium tumefaciens]|uniref:Zn-dependent hydrolase n=2 Tax=Agrobacterium tumefaciens TaxID=358 RepID=A0AAP9EAE2_AGRTU|nr:Zn-dependent hydrolase [Agrobacterium tumefaciens]NSZ60082.1 Zn-dependent hydrolase [Agrobacterium tumefaciens]QDY97799.1 Zn-dependent hydrolase [Agrobacterium tumefaciens]UXS12929.1 Zn-dependent hydrolase [Agrobacterium tumefaciens]UXS20292.1 Zn-dependent hydrolase [Agrobacterium tumefaciens]UXS27936.1 Zn-dependent hydrolase [Agrobacterium tumefaciens]